MDVKIHYDEETTVIIEQLRKFLDIYEEKLHKEVDKKTSTWTCTRDIQDSFFNDAGRHKILNEIRKVKNMAIPVKLEILGEIKKLK